MGKTWVANSGTSAKLIDGRMVLPGDGVLVDDGASTPQRTALTVIDEAGKAPVIEVDGQRYGLIPEAQAAQVQGLVSGAWNLATSGTWRPAVLGALPRFSVSGGASGGTWALSYRNAAGTVTSDPAETVAAGVTDVSPVFLDDATEIAVAITGTVTVEVK